MDDLKEHRRKSLEDRYQQYREHVFLFLNQCSLGFRSLKAGIDEFVGVICSEKTAPEIVCGYISELQDLLTEILEDMNSIINSPHSTKANICLENDYILAIIQFSKTIESFLTEIIIKKSEKCRDIVFTVTTIASTNRLPQFIAEVLKPRSTVFKSSLTEYIQGSSSLLIKVEEQIRRWEDTFHRLQNDGNAITLEPTAKRCSLRPCSQVVYCDYCTNCGASDGFQGITCPSNHNFLCSTCFINSMKAQLDDYGLFRNHHGKIVNQFCQLTQCPFTFPCYYHEDDLKTLLPTTLWEQYLKQRIHYEESLDGVYALLASFQQAITATQQSQQTRLHQAKLHITSHILTLLCPGCAVALPSSPSQFLPPGACMAVNCSLCNTYFCFWCLQPQDTSTDCHIHVAQCIWNTYAPGQSAAPSDQLLRTLQRKRHRVLIEEYLRNHVRGEDISPLRQEIEIWLKEEGEE